MTQRARASPERSFFLAAEPAGGQARLREAEARHAVRVVRIRAGDRIWGLDGAGRAWPLTVQAAGSGSLQLAVTGEPIAEPAPGAPGAPLPWIELAVSLPRPGRAEDMLARLVQLGVAALRPLVCARTQGAARSLSSARLQRLRSAAEEACKQSRRVWPPAILPACTPGELAQTSRPGALGWLQAGARTKLVDWAGGLRSAPRATAERPIVLAVGPEGGWTPQEQDTFSQAGAAALALGPHVLRVETAAEAGAATLAQVLFDAR